MLQVAGLCFSYVLVLVQFAPSRDEMGCEFLDFNQTGFATGRQFS